MNRILIIVIAVLVFIGISLGVVFLTPVKNMIFPATPAAEKEENVELLNIIFLQLPEIIINVKQNKNSRFNILKATFMVELINPNDKEAVDHLKPLIIDQFQIYLRELTSSDLEGTAGIERVRNELKRRIVNLVKPIKVRNVLFKEFLMQ
jgi:flagellar FliL protein